MPDLAQHLETNLLLGVDFVPVRRRHAGGAGAPASSPAPAASGAQDTLFGTSRVPMRRPQDAGVCEPGEPPPELDSADKPAALEALRQRHDAECPHCTTATGHTRTVFGEINPDAELMFIGEAPGEEEDRTGRPFVGRAGRKLDDMISAMKLRREDVYIANVLKTRSPENRTPLPGEVAGCAPYLAEQIRIIRPKVIVALGGPAAKWLLQSNLGITQLRGTWAQYTDGRFTVAVMPTFHPAYVLRNYTTDTRAKVWSDMQQVMQVLGK